MTLGVLCVSGFGAFFSGGDFYGLRTSVYCYGDLGALILALLDVDLATVLIARDRNQFLAGKR